MKRSFSLWAAAAIVTLLAAGCAGQPQTSAADGVRIKGQVQNLRVVTYNIALGKWLHTSNSSMRRLSRRGHSIESALKRHPQLRQFDILGVQEVCSDKHGEQLERLKKLGPYKVVFGRADVLRGGECGKGQAIVTRYEVEDWGVMTLPTLRKVRRSAVWADLVIPGGEGSRDTSLRVYNVHLDNRGDSFFAASGRLKQMKFVLAHIESWRQSNPDAALIVLGDFNSLGSLVDPWAEEATIKEMKRRFDCAADGYESTHVLSYQLDWIFYEALELRSTTVVDIIRSDHFPVVADFFLPKRAPRRE